MTLTIEIGLVLGINLVLLYWTVTIIMWKYINHKYPKKENKP